MTKIQKDLFEMQDLKYRDFHSKLIPTLDKDKIIGVRAPQLRSYAKRMIKSGEAAEFIKKLPHKYYEENNLHIFILNEMRDYDALIIEAERFLPYIDNWATCDAFSPNAFAKNTEQLETRVREWTASDKTYTVRTGLGMLMKFYLDENFKTEYLSLAAAVRSEEYYINMMIAWYFATALAKQYDAALPYLTGKKLDVWTHNKTIQKAVESYRITAEQKEYLKSLRIKK